jgi:hypothetical protein
MTRFSAALLLLIMTASLHAQDQREAVIAALRRWGMTRPVEARQVEFTVSPACADAAENWKVIGAHFDAILRAWMVEATCPKTTVPFLVVVHVDHEQPLRGTAISRKTTLILVRAGDHRELTVEFAGGRITEPVVCLRNGRAGDVIRVRSLDRKVVRRVLVDETGELILAGRR